MTDMCTACSPGARQWSLALLSSAYELTEGLEGAAETAASDAEGAAIAAAQVLAASMTAAQTVTTMPSSRSSTPAAG